MLTEGVGDHRGSDHKGGGPLDRPGDQVPRFEVRIIDTEREAEGWIERVQQAAARGLVPHMATATLADYGNLHWEIAMNGLEPKTLDLYRAGWQARLEKHEDELDDPRALALPDWETLEKLAAALVAASAGEYQGWGDVVMFEACTATRIGEDSGCRVRDVDTEQWVWTLRRQTTPGPGGLKDKGTKGKRARKVPIIEHIRPMVLTHINDARARVERTHAEASDDARREALLDKRLFVGPRGGRIATGVLRDATHWDVVVAQLGFEHLRRHDLRHTGLTWFADAGVPLHRLQQIAGHTDPRIT